MARPRSFDQDTVLHAVRDRFWSTGYSGTSVDDILTATGLGKGSLYGAFGDKHHLFMRVFDDYCTEVTEVTRRALDGPDAEAFGLLRDHLLNAAGVGLRGCLLAKGAAELAGQDEAVATRARQAFEALQSAIASCIAAAQRAGDISPEADADRLAGLVLAVLRGMEALGKGGSTPAALRDIAETALSVLPRP